MIDWDALVLGPTMALFAQPLTVSPIASQPGSADYPAEGILKVENIDIQLENGIESAQVITIGVQLSQFVVPPGPEDKVTMGGVTYWIDDTDDDGQGGSIWTMKTAPGPPEDSTP